MKKLSIVLAILLVAALAFGGWSFAQKGDLDKQVTDLKAQIESKVSELTKAKDDAVQAAQTAAEEAAAQLQEQITALTGEKDEALKAADDAKAAVADLETKLTAAADEAKAQAATLSEEAEAKLAAAQTAASEAAAQLQEQIAALAGEKDDALKTAETATAAVSDLEAKLAAAVEEAQATMSTYTADAEAKLAAAAAEAAEKAEQIAALTTEKEDAQKAVAAAEAAAADIQAQLDDLKNLMNNTYAGKTVILHSNDVHGALDGYAYMTWLRDWFKGQGADVIVADAGDFSQGTIYVSMNKGAAAIDMMNAAGYDIVTLGNHEFDYGYAQLMENLGKANFTTLCSNVIVDETGESILPATKIIETASGLKIAFVGVETPETATKVNPGLIKEIHFATFQDLYANVQASVDSVKDQADLVIGLLHLGVDKESAVNGYRSIDLLANVNGIDFALDGHSHTVMTKGENGEPIQSTGTKFAYIGVVVIDNETKQIEKNFLYNTNGMPKDEAVAAAAKAIIDEAEAKYGAVFAATEVELNGAKAPGNRTEETNLGDLITDAMVWSVVKEGGVEQVEPNHVVGITNGGGIRATIPVGDVTMKDINTVLPFGNTVAVIYVTGEELLEVLEASTFCTPDPVGGFPQTSGIEWTLDTTKAFDQGPVYVLDGKEGSYYKPASIQRVTITAVNGEPFDPAATYAIVTNNFCAAGGDTYNAFARAYNEG
ncbi:MAG: bifunctional metallophosphatase/5'-nucleotidase, partial [Clostridia bacterium]|nr:bifunctional metallophosphatase/5'-nucleotidase [Clostridia bacterium]